MILVLRIFFFISIDENGTIKLSNSLLFLDPVLDSSCSDACFVFRIILNFKFQATGKVDKLFSQGKYIFFKFAK